MQIGVICPNWVGDLVMATPTLRALRHEYPSARITAVLRPHVADVLAGLDLVDQIWTYGVRGRQGELNGWNLYSRLRQARFDKLLVLTNAWRTGLMAWLSGARERYGISRRGRSWMFTHPVPGVPQSEPHPLIDEYLSIAKAAGCRLLTRNMELATLPRDEAQLADFWDRQRVSPADRKGYVCLNPGGAFGAAKHWPVSHFAQLARTIVAQTGRSVLVLCGPAEREAARKIASQAQDSLEPLSGADRSSSISQGTAGPKTAGQVFHLADEEVQLGLTKAAIRHAGLLITTDSGPRHFAAPLKVPVITLFGATHIAWSETFYSQARHLQLSVPCGPCQQRVCPLKHHRCMRDLTPAMVWKTVQELLPNLPVWQAA